MSLPKKYNGNSIDQDCLGDLSKSGISEKLARDLGIYQDTRDSYVIPFNDPATSQPMQCLTDTGELYYRRKMLNPAAKQKYLSSEDSGVRAYILPRVHESIEKTGVVILTEGEKKAIAGSIAGVDMVGLAGNFGYMTKAEYHPTAKHVLKYGSGSDTKNRVLLPELERYAKAGGKWIVIWDSDASDKTLSNAVSRMNSFFNATKKLADLLKLYGVELYRVDLPSLPNQRKVGVDDFLQKKSPRDLTDYIQKERKVVQDIYWDGPTTHKGIVKFSKTAFALDFEDEGNYCPEPKVFLQCQKRRDSYAFISNGKYYLKTPDQADIGVFDSCIPEALEATNIYCRSNLMMALEEDKAIEIKAADLVSVTSSGIHWVKELAPKKASNGSGELDLSCQKFQMINLKATHAKQFTEMSSIIKKLKPLQTIVGVPVLRQHKEELVVIDSYSRDFGVFVTGKFKIDMNLPVSKCKEILHKLTIDYKTATPSDSSRLMSSFITPALKMSGLVGGKADFTPIFRVAADLHGTGKGFKMMVIQALYGEPVFTLPVKESGGVGSVAESMSTALLDGSNFLLLDNVRSPNGKPFGDMWLEMATTMPTVSCRAPHSRAEMVNTEFANWYITDNGQTSFNSDLSDRLLNITLRKRDQDYKFSEYSEGTLVDHVTANHSTFLSAIFSLINHWFKAGKPRRDTGHRMKAWAGILSYIIEDLLGMPKLLGGHNASKEINSDPAAVWIRSVAQSIKRNLSIGSSDDDSLEIDSVIGGGSNSTRPEKANFFVTHARDYNVGWPSGHSFDDRKDENKEFRRMSGIVGSAFSKLFKDGKTEHVLEDIVVIKTLIKDNGTDKPNYSFRF